MFNPSHSIKILGVFSRLVWWLVLALIVTLIVASATLHLWIVPRIEAFRAPLEQQAQSALGVPVKIGGIRAYSSTFLPTFELTNVVIEDANHQPAISLDAVVLTLSPRSLLALSFEQITIERPNLRIRRDKTGAIWIANIDFSKPQSTNTSALDWFFSLQNFRINQGVVQWTDEGVGSATSPPPSLILTNLGFSSSNPFHRHLMRLDATPPAHWGAPFSVVGHFTQSLIHTDRSRFDQWTGEVFADFSQIDTAQLQQHVRIDPQRIAGHGAARIWLEIQKGLVDQVKTDLALHDVKVQLTNTTTALALDHLSGQIDGKRMDQGIDFSTQGLQFQTRTGLVWPGGNVQLRLQHANTTTPASGQFKVDSIDLAIVRQLASSLPLEAQHLQLLDSLAPEGLIKTAEAKWQGPWDKPIELKLTGRVEGLTVAAHPAVTAEAMGRPGLSGATVDFDLTRTTGTARVQINQGSLTLPGVWEDPHVPITQLAADVSWRLSPSAYGQKIQVTLNNGVLTNPDADGQFNATWETSDPTQSSAKSPYPGIIHLQGKLSRANGARVWRYLPLLVTQSARDYVRLAIREGSATDTRFTVRGDLNDMPFTNPQSGQFLIESKVNNTVLAYVPTALQDPGEAPWPEFTQLSGDLIFSGHSMEVRDAKAAIHGLNGLKISKASVTIADLEYPIVKVQAQAAGPLDDILTLVNQSPLNDLSGGALSRAKASGMADTTFTMSLPIDDLQLTQLDGSIKLAGNALQLSPDTPILNRASGQVVFSQLGFQIKGAKASMLGGEVEFEGGSTRLTANGKPRVLTESQRQTEPTVAIKGKGQATALGLRQAAELGFVPRFAQFTTGATPYTVQLAVRNGYPELLVTSNLQGLALHLPPPFYKAAETSWPFVFDTHLAPNTDPKKTDVYDSVRVQLGQQFSANYVRRLIDTQSKVVRGDVRLGQSNNAYLPQPANGVGANMAFSELNVDAWSQLLRLVSPPSTVTTDTNHNPTTDYLPQIANFNATSLLWEGRTFDNVAISLARDGATWRANVNAKQLAGYVEYEHSATSPRLFARLLRAQLGATQQAEVEQVLENATQQVPALDLQIDNFELAGKSLGTVQIEAVNQNNAQGRSEWRLNKLQLVQPFAKLTATGTWSDSPTVNLSPTSVPLTQRRMLLNFLLDINNAGDLLAWAGHPKTVRGANGKLEGTIAWQGSPFAVHYPSLTGQMAMTTKNGQFLKVDPGAAKLLGILSLQSLPRRLTLDFRDLFSEGFAFDSITADVSLDKGIAKTDNLQMKGLNALVLLQGSTDLVQETQTMRVMVIPEINAVGASLAYATINPAIALGSLLAQFFLAKPLAEANTREYSLVGTWADPIFTQIKHSAADKTLTKPPEKRTPLTQ